jgi:hypothetical protein
MSDLFDVSKETILITSGFRSAGSAPNPTPDGAILLLATSASRYTTGSVVTVDGGFY